MTYAFAILLLSGVAGFAQDIDVRPNMIIVKFSSSAFQQGVVHTNRTFDELTAAIGGAQPKPLFPYKTTQEALAKQSASQQSAVRFWEQEMARVYVLTYSSPVSPWELARQISTNDIVEYAEPSFIYHPVGGQKTPDDSLFAQQKLMKTVQAEAAWDISEGSPTILIGISDTDIKWDHPDLIANIWINPGESGTDSQGKDKKTNGFDDDGNGFVDDWHGWDFGGTDGNTPDNDTRSATGGHGTMVAGLAGAVTNNRIGVSSLGNTCKILPMKIGADGGGSLYYGLESIDYASRMGCRVFNASWGGFGASKTMEDAINLAMARGMTVVGGGGNHGGIQPFYPAAYPSVLDVGVCTPDDIVLGESGFGPPVDVMSPGDGSWTITLGDGYGTFAHTSAAAPIVAGLAGLVAAHFPSYRAEQVRERIRVTSDDIDSKNLSKAKFIGKGRINAYRALSDPATPSLRITSSQVVDPNNDKRLDINETIGMIVTLKNYLDGTGAPVTLTLVPVQNASSVQVTKGSVSVGAVSGGSSVDNSSDPFTFTVTPSAAFDAVVLFRVDIQAGNYEDFDFVSITVNPSYRNMKSNQLMMTIMANGMFGYNDYPGNKTGDGMLLGTTSTQLYLGSVMIGTDEQHIVDNARDTQNFLARTDDFRITVPVSVYDLAGGAKAKSINSFTDAGADASRRLNVEVLHEVFDFSNLGINDVLFSKFTVKNGSQTALNGLRFSLFMDFGGYPNYYPASVAYDSTIHFGYVTKTGFPLVGTFVVDSLPLSSAGRSTFWGINNDHRVPGNPFGTLDGFTYAERWRAMSSYAGNRTVSSANVAYVLTAPVADIQPGATATFVFGQTAATNLVVARNNVNAAVNLWRNPFLVGVQPQSAIRSGIRLAENFPNPVLASSQYRTVFPVSIAQPGTVAVELYSMLGIRLASWEVPLSSAGEQLLPVNTTGMPAGAYILRAAAAQGTVQRSFLVVE